MVGDHRSMKSIVLTGPQGCGKTHHAEEIARLLGLSRVVDGWVHGDPVPKDDALIITNEPEPAILFGLRVIRFEDVARMLPDGVRR